VVFEWVRELNRAAASGELAPARAAAALAAWQRLDAVLGVGAPAETPPPPEILALAGERQAARRARDFQRADTLRDALKARGWVVEDTPKGPKLKRI
jgi:cysteinyl-tRNA synthetase